MSDLFFSGRQQRGTLWQLLLLIVYFSVSITKLHAQVSITTFSDDNDIKSAIVRNLGGEGVTISNVVLFKKSDTSQIGEFNNGTEAVSPHIGISKGLVLSTGDTETLAQSSKNQRGTRFGGRVKDSDLEELLGQSRQYDPVIITFDLTPRSNNLTIDFVFGSDEYEKYVGNNRYVDAYGFFIKGPGINGNYSDNAINAAELPNGDRVSTNFVNRVKNKDYYIRNPDVTFDNNWTAGNDRGNHVALNGWTRVITSYLPVQAGQVYTVKIALGEGGDSQYDSSVFIGKFKSQRLFKGRIFHHRTGMVDEQALAEGDETKYDYFKNTKVVLFNANGQYLDDTRTGPRGEYSFSVTNFESYKIGIDASTFTPGDNDADVNDLYPEQTWSSAGGQCANGQGGIKTLEASGYCYGGKTGAGRDYLFPGNRYDLAEHVVHVPSGTESHTNLNFGFSYDVVTHTNSVGQGSLLNFVHAANRGEAYGTGQMLFVPAVPKNTDQGWKITVGGQLPALTRANATIDGRAYDLVNPGSYAICESVPTPTLVLATSRNEPLLTLNGTGQKVCNTMLTGDNTLQRELIKLHDNSSKATIINNHLVNNRAPGVTVTGKAYHNHITRNRYQNLVANSVNLPIDLKGNWQIDANTGGYQSNQPNRAIDRPIITDINADTPNQLTISGFSHEGSKIEFYRLTHRGYQFFAEATEGSRNDKDKNTSSYNDPVGGKSITENRFQFVIPLAGSELPSQLAAIAIDTQGNTSEFSLPISLSATITASIWHDLNENGSQEADEPGLAGINVELSSTSGKATTKSTDENGYVTFPSLAAGDYEIHVPNQNNLSGLTLGPTMGNPQNITIGELKTYSVSFGYVTSKGATLTPEHQKSTAPGLFVHFPHTLTSDSDSTVTLTAQWINDNSKIKNRTAAHWPIKLEKLPSCKIGEQRSTKESTSTLELALSAKEPECFLASFFVPAGTSQGVWGRLKITATSEADGEIKELAQVIDQITVTDGGSGRLRLQKWVKAKGENNSTTNEAGSGDILTYTIQFQNIGAGPLTDLNIMDDTPAFTVLSEAVKCPDSNTLPKDLGRCELTLLGGDNAPGFRGRIIWNFDGILQPGAGGEVSYDLLIE